MRGGGGGVAAGAFYRGRGAAFRGGSAIGRGVGGGYPIGEYGIGGGAPMGRGGGGGYPMGEYSSSLRETPGKAGLW